MLKHPGNTTLKVPQRLLAPMPEVDALCHLQSSNFRRSSESPIGPSLKLLGGNDVRDVYIETQMELFSCAEAGQAKFGRRLGIRKAIRGAYEVVHPAKESPPGEGIIKLLRASLSLEKFPKAEYGDLAKILDEAITVTSNLERVVEYAATLRFSPEIIKLLEEHETKVAAAHGYPKEEVSKFRRHFLFRRNDRLQDHQVARDVAEAEGAEPAIQRRHNYPVVSDEIAAALKALVACKVEQGGTVEGEIYKAVQIQTDISSEMVRSKKNQQSSSGKRVKPKSPKEPLQPKYQNIPWDSVKDDGILLVKGAGELSVLLAKLLPALRNPDVRWGKTTIASFTAVVESFAILREELIDVVDSIAYARNISQMHISTSDFQKA